MGRGIFNSTGYLVKCLKDERDPFFFSVFIECFTSIKEGY